MSLSTSSISSMRSSSSGIGVQMSAGVESSHAPSQLAYERVAGSTNGTVSLLPHSGTGLPTYTPANHAHPPSANGSNMVPVWRSVGEKSALRGYLTVLGVTQEASLADIRGAYKKLALQWHPDRSDAPNARMKFQEISQAYMALCVEDGDAQDIDVGLYERESQQVCESLGYYSGLAGVTNGLAGVFCSNINPFMYKSPGDNLHLDLYRNGGVKTKHPTPHGLTCTCHAHMHQHTTQQHQITQHQQHQPHQHTANCGHAHGNDLKTVEPPPSTAPTHTTTTSTTATTNSTHHDEIASAAAADISLLTGILAPPVIAVGDNSVQVRIAPINYPVHTPIVYQIQLKIKKTYQLVYQGAATTYTVPNLVPGTKYMFRVRAAQQPIRLAVSSSTNDSDDELDLDAVEEIPADVADETTGLGVWSQPTTVTTQGTKPDGNAPHPPVLSNLQLAALKKKESKGGKKKSGGQKNKDAATTSETNTPPQEPADSASTTNEPHSNASTPTKSSRSLDSASNSSAVAAPPSATTPSPSAASTAASQKENPTLSKKEAKLRAKQAEEEKRKAEAAAEAQRKLDEEIAYQKFIMEKREEAERIRLAEEQKELERYAKLKEEQDQKRKQEEAEAKKQQNKRGGKKGEKPNATPSKETSKETPPATPQQNGRAKKGEKTTKESPNKAAAAAPIIHIKLTPEQQPAATKPTPVVAAAAPTNEKSNSRVAKKTPATVAPTAASTSPVISAAVAPVLPSPAVPTVTKPAWGSPSSLVTSAATKSKTDSPAQPQIPIILKRPQQPGTKAWSAATPTLSETPSLASGLLPLSLGTSALTGSSASDSLLSDHLNRFDSTKPWQADLLAQQQAVREAQLQQQQSHYQSVDPTARFQHIAAYTASHSLNGPTTATPFSSSLSLNGAPSSSVWSSSEDDLLLSDLQHELERERWNVSSSHTLLTSPTSAAAEAAWNNTANTTVGSNTVLQPPMLSSSSLHFAPLSSLLSDTYPDSSTSAFASSRTTSGTGLGSAALNSHDGIFMPTASNTARTSTTAPGTGFFSSAPTTNSSLSSFPTTGLSRDAPSFNPTSQPSTGLHAEPTISGGSLLSHTTNPISGHTRLPLSAVHASNSSVNSTGATPATSALGGGLFSSFGLPSFSSFSSFNTQSTTGAGADWGSSTGSTLNPSTAALLHDDSDADLFHSIPALQTDTDDVIISGGSTAIRPKCHFL